MKTKFTLCLFIAFFTSNLFAFNSLQIIDPDRWWHDGHRGSIDEATIIVQPQGLYTNIEMILTISENGSNLDFSGNREIVMDFDLPEGTIVYDSWLWMLDNVTIVQADVVETWSAINIYESIVDRNTDPSILYKRSDGGYHFRIFPLVEGESRKIKISYLVPNIWDESSIKTWLPTDILKTSFVPLDNFTLIIQENENFENPRILGNHDIIGQPTNLVDYGWTTLFEFPGTYLDQPLQFAAQAPFNENNLFIQQFEDQGDKFYELAYFPPPIEQLPKQNNVLLLFDNQGENSEVEALADYAKTMLLEYLDEDDKVNFGFNSESSTNISFGFWINVDELFIDLAIEHLKENISGESNLTSLIEDGISFITESNEGGEIILFTNSETDVSNYYYSDIAESLVNENIKINVVNYRSQNYYWDGTWNGASQIYFSNQNFLHNICESTFGKNIGPLTNNSSNIWEGINQIFNEFNSTTFDFDLFPTAQAGFTFDRFYQNYLGQSTNSNQVILQSGKYSGNPPTSIEFFGSVENSDENEFIYENVSIQESDLANADSLCRESWYGHKIKELEVYANDNQDILTIIEMSKQERVLSSYTAFLAVDLENGAEECATCEDLEVIDQIISEGDFTTEIEEVNSNQQFFFTASPNPFSDFCMIEIQLEEEMKEDELVLLIFDGNGKLILKPVLNGAENSSKFQFKWDGKDDQGNDLPNGIYFINIQNSKMSKSIKVIKK